jgi:methylation protein EvaC
MKCRITKNNCQIFLNLGQMPLANGFLKKKQIKYEFFYPLKVAYCKKLSLVQLVKNPSPNKMFNSSYPFYTSSSKFMINHFNNFANWIKKKNKKKFSILEIGSNDGTFLKNFKNYFHYGYEPSRSVHKISKRLGINSINKFFDAKNVKNLINKKYKFDFIVGSNVFCHIPNQVGLIKTIDKLLAHNGSLIFEEPYLGAMYKKISYDQLYDEHIFMFSATSIKKIYELFNFQLVDAIPQDTHGGSMRYVIKKYNYKNKITKRLFKILKHEKSNNIHSLKGCLNFSKQVKISKNKLIDKLKKIKSKNHKICGYGATSKSTTILNYCNINSKTIDCIFDTTKDKIGKITPGTHIPIVDYKFFKNYKFKYVFLFAWNHKKEILNKEKNNKNIQWFNHLKL